MGRGFIAIVTIFLEWLINGVIITSCVGWDALIDDDNFFNFPLFKTKIVPYVQGPV